MAPFTPLSLAGLVLAAMALHPAKAGWEAFGRLEHQACRSHGVKGALPPSFSLSPLPSPNQPAPE
ncbi:hypothetical protein GCM10019060_23380 [Novosphingobium pokkalii]|nr:hypothetical protein GCM10019060_23380 [Novosphingobium pokkalii]